jgi:hypothetical protein
MTTDDEKLAKLSRERVIKMTTVDEELATLSQRWSS